MRLRAVLPATLALLALVTLSIPAACHDCCPIPTTSSATDCTIGPCGSGSTPAVWHVGKQAVDAGVHTPTAAAPVLMTSSLAAPVLEAPPHRLYLKIHALLI